jgi:hypothetical protein
MSLHEAFLSNAAVGVSDPRGPSTGPTSEFDAACPSPDGLMQDGTQEGG